MRSPTMVTVMITIAKIRASVSNTILLLKNILVGVELLFKVGWFSWTIINKKKNGVRCAQLRWKMT